MQLQSHQRKTLRRISLTPLADLVFILLVFFIIETSFTEFKELVFKTPEEEAAKAKHAAIENLKIEVFPGGKLWMGGEHVALADLTPWLIKRQLAPKTVIILKAQDAVALQVLVDAKDQLRAQSLEHVVIQALEND